MHQNCHEQIIDKLQEIIPRMAGQKIVYIAGDSRACAALNKYFRNELHWDAKQIKNYAFLESL